ncbi:Winged helix-turn-helix DNA-binding domain [Phytophthora cactorum]|nr:Winged helix-turn-helix DNA-binding domain [Phytophthora cactorum]
MASDLKKDFAPVVAAVRPKLPQLLALEAETDVEGAFVLLFDVVLQIPNAQDEALKILQVIKDDTKASAVLRLRVAAALFNKAKSLPKVQLQALLDVLDLARSSNNVELVAPYLTQVETLLTVHTLSVEERRTLLLAVADVLDQADDKLKVLAVLEQYLSTYEQGQVAKEQAKRAVQIASLKGEKVLDLLDIVSTKTLKEFVAFQKSAGAVIKDGLVEAELADTMRLFTLCTLPTGFQQIKYADVAAALDVAEQDVEKWVVRAITAGVVNAKIDQLARTWKEIDTKLQLYKKNVGGLLDIIRNARRAQEQQ